MTYFFCQVVEIKLQFEIYEKRLKALSLQKASVKGTSYIALKIKHNIITLIVTFVITSIGQI